jgi:hypothetical protein
VESSEHSVGFIRRRCHRRRQIRKWGADPVGRRRARTCASRSRGRTAEAPPSDSKELGYGGLLCPTSDTRSLGRRQRLRRPIGLRCKVTLHGDISSSRNKIPPRSLHGRLTVHVVRRNLISFSRGDSSPLSTRSKTPWSTLRARRPQGTARSALTGTVGRVAADLRKPEAA